MQELSQKFLRHDFIRFCLVGTLGFIINLLLLTLLYRIIGWPVFVAQLISSEIALGSNFILHHTWTYKGHGVHKSVRRLLIEFHATSWVAILGTSAIVWLGVHSLKVHYVIALIIASVIALGWNYIWTKFVIWQHHQKDHTVGTAKEKA